MKVLAVSSYGVLGGAELSMATFLDHRPATIDAQVLLVSDGPIRQRLLRDGLPTLIASGYVGKPTAARIGRFTRSLASLLRADPPDVIWAVGLKAAFLAAPAARMSRVPIVWHRVDFAYDRVLTPLTAAAVDGVVTVSEAAAGSFRLLRSRLLGVVHPPVVLDGELDAEPDPSAPVIGTLARLIPYKGHHHMVEATAILAREFPSVRLVLAGGEVREYPDYPRSLRELAVERGISDSVELPGFVSPRSVLERMSVFVNATYLDEDGYGLEGLSGAMLEASWAGVPVVATRGGGTAEGIVDRVTGTLIDRATPQTLAAAIRPYLADHELAARTGAEGKRFAREAFAPDAASQRLFALLGQVAGR